MEQITFHQQIMQGMYNLNSLLNLDVIWYNASFDIQHRFQSMNTPDALDFDIKKEYPLIDERCRQKGILRYCIAATASFLEFVFIPLYNDDCNAGLVRIGPFVTGPIDDQQLSNLFLEMSLSITKCHALRSFYESLPMLQANQAKNIGHIGLNLFGQSTPRAHSCLYQSEKHDNIPSTVTYDETEILDVDTIQQRYAHEHFLMETVAKGDLDTLEKAVDFITSPEMLQDISNRFPENPLRSVKNLTIVSNTILRHAAEKGGLNPVYLHQISTKYALMIEQATTRTAVDALQAEMPYAYAKLVKKYAHPDASPFIRKVIDYLQLNLNKPLGMDILSEHFNIQPSNLANKFKKETGQTITEFVNAHRIDEACYYLINSDRPISEISQHVGILDANYFSRLFKKHMGVTPLSYRLHN